MSVAEAPRSHGLIQRATNILLHPKAEWDVIAAEPATVQGIFVYAAVLAAIPAIARIVHGLMPFCFFVACYTANPCGSWPARWSGYVVSLAGVFVVGLIIDALAPGFGGEKNQVQAMKAAVYSWTAAWLAGVFVVIPFFGWLLSLVGLYSFYLLYVGLPRTHEVARGAVARLHRGRHRPGHHRLRDRRRDRRDSDDDGRAQRRHRHAAPASPVSGTVHLGNGASVDLDKLAAAGQQAEAQMKAQQQGGPNKVVGGRSGAAEGAAAGHRRRRRAHRRLGHQRRRGRLCSLQRRGDLPERRCTGDAEDHRPGGRRRLRGHGRRDQRPER